jgi:hypothetical protein
MRQRVKNLWPITGTARLQGAGISLLTLLACLICVVTSFLQKTIHS